MNRTRGRLVVACLAVIGAAIAVAGGSAGNRTATTPFEFLPGDSFTYGETFATEATITNSGSSMFTQIEVHHAMPAVADRSAIPATLLDSSCGAVIEGNEAVCRFGSAEFQVHPHGDVRLARAEHRGGCTADDERLLAHQGREANQPQRAFRRSRAGRSSASLLGNDPTTERKRAGGYETAGRRDLYGRVGQPAHQPGAHARTTPSPRRSVCPPGSRSRREASRSGTRR